MTKPLRFAALAALLAGISACTMTGVSNLEVHEILLYGLGERHALFYGEISGVGNREVSAAGRAVSLSNGRQNGALAVPGTLAVDGAPSLRLATAALGERFAVASVPLSADVSLATRGGLEGVYLYDGRAWSTVSGPVNGDQRVRLRPAARQGLRGVGQLTDPEADALSAYLAGRGAVAVGLLAPEAVPDARLAVDPVPRDYKRTALFVQVGVPTDLLGGLAPRPVAAESRPLGSGGNSAYADETTSVRLDRTAAAFAQTWATVGGNQVPAPAPPSVDFARERAVTIFLGRRNTGGYGITVAGVRLEGDTLVVEVTVRAPASGAITTQALTSPYVSVAVTGEFTAVRVVNRDGGQVIAQTGTR